MNEAIATIIGAVIAALSGWASAHLTRRTSVDVALLEGRLSQLSKQADGLERLQDIKTAHANEIAKLNEAHQHQLDTIHAQGLVHDKARLEELRVAYAKDLRDRRIEAYKEFWKHLEKVALYHPKQDVTLNTLRELGEAMREWYFTVGGLLLSIAARDQYFRVQDALVEVLRAGTGRSGLVLRDAASLATVDEFRQLENALANWTPGKNASEDYVEIRRRLSLLRTELCKDIGSREAAIS